jgi:hypothetical protein
MNEQDCDHDWREDDDTDEGIVMLCNRVRGNAARGVKGLDSLHLSGVR